MLFLKRWLYFLGLTHKYPSSVLDPRDTYLDTYFMSPLSFKSGDQFFRSSYFKSTRKGKYVQRDPKNTRNLKSPIRMRDLTHKEKKYFSFKKLGEGWKRIESTSDCIRWIHQNLSPDEFEHFCISVLSTHCKVPIRITEKHPISGADGGLDGTGEFQINGRTESVALQAKRYANSHWVTDDEGDRFVGALFKRGWKYGFFITTSIFSPQLKESVKEFEKKGIFIELIDQKRLAEIMLMRQDQPHGYGLHCTDEYKLVYFNEGMLRDAAKPQSDILRK